MIILTLLPQSLHPITNKTILRTENSTFSKPSLPYSNYTNAYLGYSPFPVWGLSTQPKQRSKDSTVFGTTLIHGAALNGGTRKSTREAIGNQNQNQSSPISSHAIWLIAIFCSRDDKRYTEKKNKSERARRKKEDTAKLRGLVDLTLRYKFLPASPQISPFISIQFTASTPALNYSNNKKKKHVKPRRTLASTMVLARKRPKRSWKKRRSALRRRRSRKRKKKRFVPHFVGFCYS
jgi:hypothetical protein